jgi:hypothetical protein
MHQRDTQRHPCALEYEEPDVVVWICLDRQGDDGSRRGDEWGDPCLSDMSAKVASKEQVSEDHKKEAERKQYEILGRLSNANDFNQHLDDEYAKESNAGQREPHASASTPGRFHQRAQAPERDAQRDYPAAIQEHIHNGHEIRR